MGFAVSGLCKDDGGNALPGQVEAGSQAVALEKNNKKLGYKFKKLYSMLYRRGLKSLFSSCRMVAVDEEKVFLGAFKLSSSMLFNW